MREIKFKAKLSHSKQWVIGNLVIAQDGQPYIIPSEVFEPDGHHLKIDSDEPYWVDKKTISQFTGLTDKNGVEVYEGDIVRYPNDVRNCEVIYIANDYGAGFLTDSHDGVHSLGDLMNTVEVIGNIHSK